MRREEGRVRGRITGGRGQENTNTEGSEVKGEGK